MTNLEKHTNENVISSTSVTKTVLLSRTLYWIYISLYSHDVEKTKRRRYNKTELLAVVKTRTNVCIVMINWFFSSLRQFAQTYTLKENEQTDCKLNIGPKIWFLRLMMSLCNAKIQRLLAAVILWSLLPLAAYVLAPGLFLSRNNSGILQQIGRTMNRWGEMWPLLTCWKCKWNAKVILHSNFGCVFFFLFFSFFAKFSGSIRSWCGKTRNVQTPRNSRNKNQSPGHDSEGKKKRFTLKVRPHRTGNIFIF